ncbi:DNA-binding transcriptional MerR regulator [Rhodobium orientis]|uniref:MerR family transcriptional regulator n=1 Tax=Rhodobium orientis TaxID=34017 RepID=A0A327JSY3_9HYPH|nr:MerR family transcriptional regulator [Rhodobium orientis]MBB4302500.1 DNA-binding transcriptional MerR regulator [Rhodobium orientis]MBK5949349.1 MerR family transcriptional regulator [Rhodobium orientis]RAI28606.1 MerR family transcriptional regulator [Rhodobium orientis]
MQIGTLSERTGVSVRMLRYYEAEGLLAPARRASGYRDYGPEDEETVHRIRMLNEAGLKLDLIRRFLPCVTSDRPDFDPCPDLLAALRGEVARLDDRIGALEQSRTVIGRYLEEVEAGI